MDASLREILKTKGGTVFTVSERDTVADAVALMNRCRIGSVVVMGPAYVRGIFTERDVLVRVVEPNLDPELTPVASVMTRAPTCASPTTTVCEAMEIMTRRRQRHLPVCEGRRLLGLVSLGDLVHHVSQHLERQVFDLTTFVHGPAAAPDISLLPVLPSTTLRPPSGVAA